MSFKRTGGELNCQRFKTQLDLNPRPLEYSCIVLPLDHCTLLVRSGGHAVEHRTFNRGDGGSIPPTCTAISKLGQFRSPHICLCLSEETKNRWPLLSGVYVRGSKRPHTGGKCVTCSGLTNSHWTLNALQRAPSSIREKQKLVQGDRVLL